MEKWMELQLALDMVTAERGMEVATSVEDLIDVLELGTPFAFANPIGVIREFKKALSKVRILADYKILDGGAIMAKMVFDAGADITTVSARTWDGTIAEVVAEAKARGCRVLGDMMGVPDAEISDRGKQLEALGIDYVCVHRAVSVKGASSPEVPLEAIRKSVAKAGVAVAGGIDLATLRKVVPHRPDLIIAGSSITSVADPCAVVVAMRGIMDAAG